MQDLEANTAINGHAAALKQVEGSSSSQSTKLNYGAKSILEAKTIHSFKKGLDGFVNTGLLWPIKHANSDTISSSECC